MVDASGTRQRQATGGATGRGRSPGAGAASRTLAVRALLAGVADAAFAVDADGRIQEWNGAAERRFGVARAEAQGRLCREVLGCLDALGRAADSSACLLLQHLRAGSAPPVIAARVRGRGGCVLSVTERVVLLPPGAGARALVLVQTSARGIVEAGDPHGPGEGRAGTRNAAATATLDLDRALDRVLLATGADAAELFLVAPKSDRLVLTAQRGRSARAFRQRTVFAPGQGFPGLVLQTGQPLVSLDLAHDPRYLRDEVKRRGFRAYLCVPVPGHGAIVGSLHLAARHTGSLLSQLPFLAEAAETLGRAIELARLRVAEQVLAEPIDRALDARARFRRTADDALGRLLAVAGADAGCILASANGTGVDLGLVAERGLSRRLHRALATFCDRASCPAIATRQSVLDPDGSAASESACALVHRGLASACCLPLEANGSVVGVAILGWRQRDPLPGRRLSLLHDLVDSAAVRLYNAGVALRDEEEALRLARSAAEARDGAVDAGDRERVRPDGPRSARRGYEPPLLDLRCLGTFTILVNGRVLPAERFPRRRSLTLLKVLLTRYGRPVHREELIDLLCPDADPETGGTLLNVAVHYLRRGLEPDLPPGERSSFVRRHGDYFQFDPNSPHRLDSQDFIAAADLGARLEGSGELAAALRAYETAIGLYAGDFLAEELYSDWCALEREYLRERFLAVLRRAARLQLVEGDADAAIACYRRALQTEPTLEDVHRALMESLWRTGRREEALRQYQACRAVLSKELGVGPVAQTESLYRRILADPVAAGL